MDVDVVEASEIDGASRRLVLIVVLLGVVAVLLGLVTAALAEVDDGSRTFFQDQIDQRPAVRQSAPVSKALSPLTIRRLPSRRAEHAQRVHMKFFSLSRFHMPHRTTVASSYHPTNAVLPTHTTSIFEDRTLRRGDVVVMAKGPSIFTGTSRFPYRDDDFVVFDRISSVGRPMRFQLDAIAKNPLQHSRS